MWFGGFGFCETFTHKKNKDRETGRQGDRETRRQGDKETGRQRTKNAVGTVAEMARRATGYSIHIPYISKTYYIHNP